MFQLVCTSTISNLETGHNQSRLKFKCCRFSTTHTKMRETLLVIPILFLTTFHAGKRQKEIATTVTSLFSHLVNINSISFYSCHHRCRPVMPFDSPIPPGPSPSLHHSFCYLGMNYNLKENLRNLA